MRGWSLAEVNSVAAVWIELGLDRTLKTLQKLRVERKKEEKVGLNTEPKVALRNEPSIAEIAPEVIAVSEGCDIGKPTKIASSDVSFEDLIISMSEGKPAPVQTGVETLKIRAVPLAQMAV